MAKEPNDVTDDDQMQKLYAEQVIGESAKLFKVKAAYLQVGDKLPLVRGEITHVARMTNGKVQVFYMGRGRERYGEWNANTEILVQREVEDTGETDTVS